MVIAAKDIPRWVQPAPTTTSGDAQVILTGDPSTVVQIAAQATSAIAATCAVAVPLAGDAELLYVDDFPLIPRPAADALVVFDNTAEVEDHLGVAACIAIADISSTGVLDTQVEASALFGLLGIVDAAPVLSADASVEFADYGQGSKPVFPFTLPTRFTDNLLDVQDAAADIVITGIGFDIAAGGFADAFVEITTPGSLEIKGNTPIFPFGFPIVFTDAANNKIGSAVVDITAPTLVVLELDGDAQAGIVAEGLIANPAVFPLLLPVVFT